MKSYWCCSAMSWVWWSLNSFLSGFGANAMNASKSMNNTYFPQCDHNIGFQRFFMPAIDVGNSRPEEGLPYVVYLDLVFRSHFDPNAKAIFGEQDKIWHNIPDLHPCLRLYVKAVPNMDNYRLALIHQQPYLYSGGKDNVMDIAKQNSTRTHTAWYGLYPGIHLYAGQIADALDIVHAGVNGLPLTNNKELYPHFFRSAAKPKISVQPIVAFYNLYGWRGRAMLIMYTPDVRMLSAFENFISALGKDGVSSSLIEAEQLSLQIPVQRHGILGQLKALQEKPSRLLLHLVVFGSEHMKDSGGLPFIDLIVTMQIEIGMWLPKYQIICYRDFYGSFTVLKLMAKLGTSYGSIFLPDVYYLEPSIVGPLIPGFIWFLGKMGTLDAVDMNKLDVQQRYGFDKWPQEDLESLIRQVNHWGGLAAFLFAANLAITQTNWFVSDYAFRQVVAHNCFLYHGGKSAARNVSLFKRCLIDMNSTHFMFPMAYSEEQYIPAPWNMFNPVVVSDPTTNTSFQVFFNLAVYCYGNVLASCSKAGRMTGHHMPVWGNGEQSDDPPADLLNCTPGMFRSKLGSCDWCPAGRHSGSYDVAVCEQCTPGSSAAVKSSKCIVCPPGKQTAQFGSAFCAGCLSGTYAANSGSSTCSLCPRGTWSNVSASSVCHKCGKGHTTVNKASVMESECVCPKGSYKSQDACEGCMEGLECEEGWPHNWATQGETVQLQPNYYSLESAPHSTYLCLESYGGCPGGPPEVCDKSKSGLVCSQCVAEDHHIVNQSCEPCPTYLQHIILLLVLGGWILIILTYYLANGQLSVSADHAQALFVCIGLMITTLQILGVVQRMNIPWPAAVESIMQQSSGYVSLDARAISLTCAVGESALAQYSIQASLPFDLCIITYLVSMTSRLSVFVCPQAELAWSLNKTLNMLGQILQAFFIAFCAIMVQPLQCYRHPNFKESLIVHPTVICWAGSEHFILLIVAALILAGFIIPYVVWCLWACYKTPAKSCEYDIRFLRTFRFLLFRFRPDCWWWGIVFLLRQTSLAFATVVPSSNPHAQLFYTSGILALYMLFVGRFQPWINAEITILDCGTCLLLLLSLSCASQFLPEPAESQGRVEILMSLFVVLACLSFWYMATVSRSALKNGVFAAFNDQKPSLVELCQEWFNFLEYAKSEPSRKAVKTIYNMNSFDRCNLQSNMRSWTVHVMSTRTHTQRVSRLHNLEGAKKIDSKLVSQLSNVPASEPTPFPCLHGKSEHTTQKPPVFEILASKGSPNVFHPPSRVVL